MKKFLFSAAITALLMSSSSWALQCFLTLEQMAVPGETPELREAYLVDAYKTLNRIEFGRASLVVVATLTKISDQKFEGWHEV